MTHPASALENNWFTVDALDDSTFGISEYGQWMKVHSYLFVGTERAILVDSGLGVGNIRTIVEELTKLPVDVITSHAHWDHTGGHHLFDRFSAHILERDWIESSWQRYTKDISNWLVKEPFSQEPPPQFEIKKYMPFHAKVDRLHRDGDVLDLGGRKLEIIHTPGHSPGHVCIHEEERGYLATADLLYKGVLLGGLKFSDPEDFHRSLLRLREFFPIGKILPGHGRLNIQNDLLDEAIEAFGRLANKALLKKNSGLHEFDRLKIQL